MHVRMPHCPRFSAILQLMGIGSFCIYLGLTYIWYALDDTIVLTSFHDKTQVFDTVIWKDNILHDVRDNLGYDEFRHNVAYANLTGRSIPWLSHPQLPRTMNKTEYQNMRRLIQYIDEVFTANNITYILVYGTLLGSYISHDILPWDDDLDLLVRLSDKQKIINLLGNASNYSHIEAIVNTDHHTNMIKIYETRSPYAGNNPWKWPFADVTYFEENDNSVWATESGQFRVKWSSFYPLHRRPFSGMWLPSPKDPRLLLQMKYKQFRCRPYHYDHKNEKKISYLYTYMRTVNCRSVEGYYPVVHRTEYKGGVKETLKVGGLDLYTVYVDEPQTGIATQPFDLT